MSSSVLREHLSLDEIPARREESSEWMVWDRMLRWKGDQWLWGIVDRSSEEGSSQGCPLG